MRTGARSVYRRVGSHSGFRRLVCCALRLCIISLDPTVYQPQRARSEIGLRRQVGADWSGRWIVARSLCQICRTLFTRDDSCSIGHRRAAERNRPIRIAHFSDLHCDASPRLETRLAETVRREHPDLIFFTGDSINSVEGFETFHKFIQSIEAIAPIISIKGDWDCDPELEFDPIARAGLLQPGQRDDGFDVERSKSLHRRHRLRPLRKRLGGKGTKRHAAHSPHSQP